MWWPAAVPARSGWASAMSVTVFSGVPREIADTAGTVSLTVDLTQEGGDVWFPIARSVELWPGNATLALSCPSAGGGACIADAVLVESEARYNDGSAVASAGNGAGLALGAMDAIVLARTEPPAHCSSSIVTV